MPALLFYNFFINQLFNIDRNFGRRAICMNGYRASCILRDGRLLYGTKSIVDVRVDGGAVGGYKTLQKPRVQREKR